MARLLLALGLMSGTSMDGIDVALVCTDGEERWTVLASATYAYGSGMRARLAAALDMPERPHLDLEALLTRLHARAVRRFLAGRAGLGRRLAVVGLHGHTLLHWPERGRTRQLGDGRLLARLLGVPVVADFRSRDVAAGGEGAPLAPVFHRAVTRTAPRPLVVLNLGGIANLTWIGADERLLAFDCGPGNALLDAWALQHLGTPMDRDGRLAAGGRVCEAALARALAHPFFARPPPKSLDRKSFDLAPVAALSPQDGAATLAAFTAEAVARALAWCPVQPRLVLVTGGGRRNPVLMAQLAERLACAVAPIERLGLDGDSLEAQCFAYLAVRALRGLPLTFPDTTGVSEPLCGGRLFRPPVRLRGWDTGRGSRRVRRPVRPL